MGRLGRIGGLELKRDGLEVCSGDSGSVMSTGSDFRRDIQSLRAVAVLLVLVFHARIGGLSAGYLGVDIFFVISGFLITGLLARKISAGRFSLADFYLGRARRLLPAAYVVYVATAVGALWILSDAAFDQYLRTLWGAMTFTSNIVLWKSLNYFAVESKYNALLHVWSLSLEEQFYFVIPLALMLAPRRHWLVLAAVFFLASLVLCFWMVPRSPAAAFYLLPTRAWELALGGIVALAEPRLSASARELAARLTWPAFAVLIVVPVVAPGVGAGFAHPGLDALLVCLATALLIVGRARFLAAGPVASAGVWLGGISYSLYLVHWPLFAFANNAYLGQMPPLWVRCGLLLLSLLLAYLLARWVEDPVRRRPLPAMRWQSVAVVVMATVVVGGFSYLLRESRTAPRDYARLVLPNYGLNAACDQHGRFVGKPECQSGMSPATLVWGDSFAMHIVPGLAAAGTGAIVQATMSGCAPALGVAQFVPAKGLAEDWSRDCIAFNESVVAYLSAHPEIETVVLSSIYAQVLGGEERGFVKEGSRLRPVRLDSKRGLEGYRATVRAIHALGRRVVLVGPTPSMGVDMAECMMRREMGLLTLGAHGECELQKDEVLKYRHLSLAALEQLRREPDVKVIDLIERMCPGRNCMVELDGQWLFRDAGHLGNEGSRILGDKGLLSIAR